MGKEKVEVKLTGVAVDFLDYLHTIKNASNGTLVKYESNMREFYEYTISNKKRKEITNNLLKQLTLNDLYRYLTYTEKELNNAPATRARKAAFLKSYFKYLFKVKIIKDNIAEELELPKLPNKKPITLNLEQSRKLLQSLNKGSYNYSRDKCIITLFLHCGLRISELCSIKLNDIKEDRIKIFGKGSKERYVYLDEQSLLSIKEYFSYREDDKATEWDKQYLFLSKRQRRINENTVRKMVEGYFEDADLTDKKYTPHKLRGTYATLMNSAGANIKQIMLSMGHENMNTTNKYISVEEKELKELVKNNPLNNLLAEKGE